MHRSTRPVSGDTSPARSQAASSESARKPRTSDTFSSTSSTRNTQRSSAGFRSVRSQAISEHSAPVINIPAPVLGATQGEINPATRKLLESANRHTSELPIYIERLSHALRDPQFQTDDRGLCRQVRKNRNEAVYAALERRLPVDILTAQEALFDRLPAALNKGVRSFLSSTPPILDSTILSDLHSSEAKFGEQIKQLEDYLREKSSVNDRKFTEDYLGFIKNHLTPLRAEIAKIPPPKLETENPINKIYDGITVNGFNFKHFTTIIGQTEASKLSVPTAAFNKATKDLQEADKKIAALKYLKKYRFIDSSRYEFEINTLTRKRAIAQQEVNCRGYQLLTKLLELNNTRTVVLVKERDNQQNQPTQQRKKEIETELTALSAHYRAASLQLYMWNVAATEGVGYPATSWTQAAKNNLAQRLPKRFGVLKNENLMIEEEELRIQRHLALLGHSSIEEAYGVFFQKGRQTVKDLRDPVSYAKNFFENMTRQKLMAFSKELGFWVRDHPAEAQIFAANLNILKKQYEDLNLFQIALAGATARNQVRDLVSGEHAEISGTRTEHGLSLEMLLLLHASSYMPTAVATYQAVAGKDWAAKAVGDLAGAAVELIPGAKLASGVVNFAVRGLVGLGRVNVQRKLGGYLARNRDVELGLSALRSAFQAENLGEALKKARAVIEEREALKTLGTMGTNIEEVGLWGAIKRPFQKFGAWFKKSTLSEKLIRGLAEAGIPIGVFAAAAIPTAIAIVANPVGPVILAGIAGIALAGWAAYRVSKLIGYVIRINSVPDNLFGIKTTRKAVQDHMTQIRIQDAKKNLAEKLKTMPQFKNPDAQTNAVAALEISMQQNKDLGESYLEATKGSLIADAQKTQAGQFLGKTDPEETQQQKTLEDNFDALIGLAEKEKEKETKQTRPHAVTMRE